jgi:hypothetical protein
MIHRHGQDTQTLHAELLALLLAAESDRAWSHLAGTFVEKEIAGGTYVYFQHSDAGGKKRQFAVGPASHEVRRVVAAWHSGRAANAADRERIDRLARLLVTAGQAATPKPVGRVLRALADAGVFRLGGVLVGTHAFALLGNMLGVAWPAGTWRTEDVDVAGHLQVATPLLDADIPKAIDSLRMGFVPVPAFDPRHASTSFKVRGKQLRVDLLTPGADRDQAPVLVPRWRAHAAPIKHLSLVLDDAQPAAAVDGGATLVMVPSPARYALHKLFVSQTRAAAQQTKAAKDLEQAALLLEVLAEDRPDDVTVAARAFRACGPAVTRKLERAANAAAKRWPAAAAGVRSLTRVLTR